jgi:hypothetical protein
MTRRIGPLILHRAGSATFCFHIERPGKYQERHVTTPHHRLARDPQLRLAPPGEMARHEVDIAQTLIPRASLCANPPPTFLLQW